jgi:hypothetical protein
MMDSYMRRKKNKMVYADQSGKLYTEEELNKLPLSIIESRMFHVVE